MDALMEKILDCPNASPQIRKLFRYGDNVFCVWSGSTTALQTFLSQLNKYHDNIKFTVELGTNKINFLDLTIPLNEYNNVLQPTFKVFRQPTFTDVSIHGRSSGAKTTLVAQVIFLNKYIPETGIALLRKCSPRNSLTPEMGVDIYSSLLTSGPGT